MTVEIPIELQPFVLESIARGDFKSESEVVSRALRELEERQRSADHLRRAMEAGLDDFDRGDFEVFDDVSLSTLCDQIKAEGRQELQRRSKHQ